MYQRFKPNFLDTNSKQKIDILRSILNKKKLDGFFIPQSDKFQGEFLSFYDLRLEWLTGFSGSAGLAVVLKSNAAIFVDGRYEAQLESEIDKDIFETKQFSYSNLTEWINKKITKKKSKLGFDPWLFSVSQLLEIEKNLKKEISLKGTDNLIDSIWKRNKEKTKKFYVLPKKYSGMNKEDKIKSIVQNFEDNQEFLFLSKPESVCWLLNLRGKDYPHNPLLKCYAILHKDRSIDLFLDLSKLNKTTKKFLKNCNLVDINLFVEFLKKFKNKSIVIDDTNCPYKIYEVAKTYNIKLIFKKDPCLEKKAIKNEIEIKNAKNAHIVDGSAFTNFLYWINNESSKSLDEITIIKKLEKFRIQTNKLVDISFDTICGSGPNGAIIHYKAKEKKNRFLNKNDLLLIDSGGQYKEGTTDITRTLSFGKIRSDVKIKNTLVLKAMINLSKFKWPQGLTGKELDLIARSELWKHGIDYNHGTGHGIGSFLSVHESPPSISRMSLTVIKPGMIVSNEPGYYKEQVYGIRIENILLVKKDDTLSLNNIPMLKFDTLTLAPISTKLIEKNLLNYEEISWLNEYHKKVFEGLKGNLNKKVRAWLKKECKPV